jgi:hypothetical protein
MRKVRPFDTNLFISSHCTKKKDSDTQHVPRTSRNLSLTLNAYIYHQQSVQERLMFGGVIEAREERLKLMREKMKKIEKMIEVENREVSK